MCQSWHQSVQVNETCDDMDTCATRLDLMLSSASSLACLYCMRTSEDIRTDSAQPFYYYQRPVSPWSARCTPLHSAGIRSAKCAPCDTGAATPVPAGTLSRSSTAGWPDCTRQHQARMQQLRLHGAPAQPRTRAPDNRQRSGRLRRLQDCKTHAVLGVPGGSIPPGVRTASILLASKMLKAEYRSGTKEAP